MALNNLSASKGDLKGEINLQWDSVKSADSYIIEFAGSKCSKDMNWKVLDIISDSRYTIRNLKSNKNYFFRVALLNKRGQGKFSEEISKSAP